MSYAVKESFNTLQGEGALTGRAIRFCLDHLRWQLSLQTHKMTGIR
jgi:organic radical activating enzyme